MAGAGFSADVTEERGGEKGREKDDTRCSGS